MVTLRDVIKKHPELLNDPRYNPKEYPRMFENALEAIVKANGLVMERTNRDDPYLNDFKIFKSSDGETLVFGDAEYDASGKVFDESGKINYYWLNVPIEKYERIQKKYSDENFIYVKGNLNFVFVLRKEAILKHSKIETMLANHNGIDEERKFARVHTNSMMTKGHLEHGKLKSWLLMVKKFYPFWRWW